MKIQISKEEYEIICDTREQDTFVFDTLIENKINAVNEKLDTGDYAIKYNNELYKGVVVERKASIDELLGNLLDNSHLDEKGQNRFFRELARAKENNTKIFLLIQDKEYYRKLITGNYISKLHKNASSAMVISLLAKFNNLHIVACDREDSPSMIHKILYYHLRERIKQIIIEGGEVLNE